jgi:hypothetical protein
MILGRITMKFKTYSAEEFTRLNENELKQSRSFAQILR